jgi:hypothetical protein
MKLHKILIAIVLLLLLSGPIFLFFHLTKPSSNTPAYHEKEFLVRYYAHNNEVLEYKTNRVEPSSTGFVSFVDKDTEKRVYLPIIKCELFEK